jgi:hypothetical protein
VGLERVIEMRSLVRELDYSKLLKPYPGVGRRPFHPAAMVGLIIYGLLSAQRSLRGLSQLAARDVGAWWMASGLIPDHSTIGKFIVMHADVLTEEFFEVTTRHMASTLGIRVGDAAGDGTVIEAAASHWKTIKLEAAQQAARDAEAAAAAAPEDSEAQAKAQAKAQATKQVEQAVAKRVARAESMRKPTGGIKVSPTEPDAVVQPVKSGAVRPSYKPSVLANRERLIVGKEVVASDEPAAIPKLIEQHQAILGAPPETTLLDANYHDINTLQFFVQANLDVLSPSGTARGSNDFKKGAQQPFSKSHFAFDEERDVYVCPEGRLLERHSRGRETQGGLEFTRYTGRKCAGCPVKTQCTKATGRTIKRYDGEELKEAADRVLEHPEAKRKYARRKEMVEPVFAELRERQGLVRFHRRGLRSVRLEFALHCVAYNIKRTLSLRRQLIVAFFYVRSPGALWRPAALIVIAG